MPRCCVHGFMLYKRLFQIIRHANCCTISGVVVRKFNTTSPLTDTECVMLNLVDCSLDVNSSWESCLGNELDTEIEELVDIQTQQHVRVFIDQRLDTTGITEGDVVFLHRTKVRQVYYERFFCFV